jgi:hypothetical protein
MISRTANDRLRRIIIARWLKPMLTSEDRMVAFLARTALDRSDHRDMRFVHWLLSNSKAMAPNRTHNAPG